MLHNFAGTVGTAGTTTVATADSLADGYTWCGPTSSRYLVASRSLGRACDVAVTALLRSAVALAEYARALDSAQGHARADRRACEELAGERASLAFRWQSARDAPPPLFGSGVELDSQRTANALAAAAAQERAFEREATNLGWRIAGAAAQAESHASALRTAEQLLVRRLGEATRLIELLAPPPPTAPVKRHRGGGVLQQVAGIGEGFLDTGKGTVLGAAGLVGLHGDLGENYKTLAGGLVYGAKHPIEFGKTAIGWEHLADGEYGYWFGALAPTAAAALLTGGAGAGLKVTDLATGASASAARAGVILREARVALAARIASGGLHPEAGVVDLSAFVKGKPIELADGTKIDPLTAAERRAFQQWWDGLPPSNLRARGLAGAYQQHVYPMGEKALGNPKPVADGANSVYGAISDAKWRGSARSFHLPESLGDRPLLAQVALDKIDKSLLEYKKIIDASDNPARYVELTVNDLFGRDRSSGSRSSPIALRCRAGH